VGKVLVALEDRADGIMASEEHEKKANEVIEISEERRNILKSTPPFSSMRWVSRVERLKNECGI
jgi:hypothetical protein